jgi:gliding motility-associated-like protein
MKYLLSLLLGYSLLGIWHNTIAQTILFTDGFETTNSWQQFGSNSPNSRILGECVAASGLKSAYITSGGTTNDCSPNGINHYGYANSSAGILETILARPVSTTCFASMQLSFDARVNGDASDYLEVVYSTDNGANWFNIGAPITNLGVFTAQNVSVPAGLNGGNFLIGFRFTYNDIQLNGNPPAIDNVLLEGTLTDSQAPIITCPASIHVYASSSCNATIQNLSNQVTVSDNCTAFGNFGFSQTPLVGTVITTNTPATITVTDQAGLNNTCNTTLMLIDTTAPAVICPPYQLVYVGTSCNEPLPNYTGLASATDNCSAIFTYNQFPAAGTTFPDGVYIITIAAQDASGNQGTCTFQFEVQDTMAPGITCPTGLITQPVNGACVAIAGNYTNLVGISDNCSPTTQMVIQQAPLVGSPFTSSQVFTMTVQDLSGNTRSCSFTVSAIDTSGPMVTCLIDTNLTTTNPCNYTIPNFAGTHMAIDNCTPISSLTFTQSPAPGTSVNGLSQVVITYQDGIGNTGTCQTTIHPIDLILPVVTCPGNQQVNNVAQCISTLPDLSGLVAVTDNCPGWTISQSPAPGTVLTSGSNTIQFVVTDAGGNQVGCTTQFIITETIPPSITCPANISTCNPVITYAPPAASDNCVTLVTQTDNSGYTSGDVFPVGITTQSYMVVDSSGNSDVCSFTVQVFASPDTARVLNDTIILCNQFDTLVEAEPIASGTGSWIVAQGTATIANPTGLQTAVSSLGLGTNLIVWVVSSPNCGTLRDTVVIQVGEPNTQAILFDSLFVCTENGSLIQGNIPSSGIGTWSTSSPIIFDDVNAPVTTLSNVPPGFHEVFWTISNIACPSTVDSAIVVRPDIASILNPDTIWCREDLPLFLNGNTPNDGQAVSWSVESGIATLSNQFTTFTNITSGQSGSIVLVYRFNHPVCGLSADTFKLQLNLCSDVLGSIPTLFTPNDDGTNDVFEIENLHELYPNAEVVIINRWGAVVFESTGYENPWNGTYKDEEAPAGTYFYSITSPDGSFEKVTGSISIIR